jgi:ABC-type antimicrobial peptide transport system permease subunit
MKRKIVALAGIIIGLLLLLGSGYLYLISNKRIFSSDKTTINEPQTSVTRTIRLEQDRNPYQITMHIAFEIPESHQQNKTNLFAYTTTFSNSKNEIVEQKSSTYNYVTAKAGKQSDTITIFTLKDLPTDTYAVTIAVQPDRGKDPAIKLNNFSFEIKEKIMNIHPLIPTLGAVIALISYFILPKKRATVAGTSVKSEKTK